MFFEFNEIGMKAWNELPENVKLEKLNNLSVSAAADIEIDIESYGKIEEEHKYYQYYASTYELLHGIRLFKLTDQEASFIIENRSENKKVSVRVNGEERVVLGTEPYVSTYIFKVSNLTFGEIKEL